MLTRIKEDASRVPKTVWHRITEGIATLLDEEGACTKPKWAYRFALVVPGADIEKRCEAACQDSYWAYEFALSISGANIEKCQESAC
jgi:hypothetical protein